MPNRVIKESIWTSPNMNKLSAVAERHFYRCLMTTDDFGCFQATELVIKGKCYPLLKSIKEKDIEKWNNELEQADIIRFWIDEDGRKYGIFLNFSKHQRVRATHNRKTPEPPEDVVCRQVSSSDRLNPNPNPNPNLKKEKDMSDSNKSLHALTDSLKKWFDEVMWPSVPSQKKRGKEPTWKEIQKLKPDEESRKRIVSYFETYSEVKATYDLVPDQFYPEMQDPVRVIKHRRFEDELVPCSVDGNGGFKGRIYSDKKAYEKAIERGEKNIRYEPSKEHYV